MRLHNWLENIFDTKSKIRILRLFYKFPEKDFTEREIADFVKMSPNTINLALRDIRKTDILTFRKIGRAHVYRLNKESAIYDRIADVFQTEEVVMESLINTIEDEMKREISCVLYGSFARGTEEWDSDLDLLIITDNPKKTERRLKPLKSRIMVEFNTRLSAVVVTMSQFLRMWKKPLIQNAMKDGILVSGASLEEAYAKAADD